MEQSRPRIIVKKKGGHGGHHGGAWKVAYADFVTAMMALFIVLWLMNASNKIQKAVGGYFKDPTGTAKKIGTNQDGSGENLPLKKEDMMQLKEILQQDLRKVPDLAKLQDQIEMTVTAEGLRIELIESEKGTFFDKGNADATGTGKELLSMLAGELGKLPNTLSLEGHTDSQPYAGGEHAGYTNWELSADRANAARRLMQQKGVGPNQVAQVRGYADQRLRKPNAPNDASNRRISVIVQYLHKSGDDDAKPESSSEHSENGEHKADSTIAHK